MKYFFYFIIASFFLNNVVDAQVRSSLYSLSYGSDSAHVDQFVTENFSGSIPTTMYSKPPELWNPITSLPSVWSAWGEKTFRTENIPLYVGVAVATTAFVVSDYETWTPLHKLYKENSTARTVFDVFEFTGDGKFQFGIAGAFALHGWATDNNKSLHVASQTVEAILACGAVVQLLKHLTGRESPIVSTTPTGVWKLFPNQIDYHTHIPHFDAFPSGHVATATTTLIVIMENYPDVTWLPYVGYSTIAMLGISMMGTGVHWLSDYPLSIPLGYTFAKLVVAKNREHYNGAMSHSFTPSTSFTVLHGSVPAISFQWSW